MLTGIGFAVVEKLIQDGTSVVATARTKGALEEIQKKKADQVEIILGDASDLSVAKNAVELARNVFGQLDGLVVNHSTLNPIANVANADLEEWKKLYETNFFSALAFVGLVFAIYQCFH